MEFEIYEETLSGLGKRVGAFDKLQLAIDFCEYEATIGGNYTVVVDGKIIDEYA